MIAQSAPIPELYGAGADRLDGVAYLLGEGISARHLDEMETGLCPRSEYFLFHQRHSPALLHIRQAERSSSTAVRKASRSRFKSWAVALEAMRRRREARAFVASGEDIGLRLALLCRAFNQRKPICVITHGSYFGSGRLHYVLQGLRGMDSLHF
ncbi:MAG TPA: hypothetical protein VGS41_15895, partial [Chthonomonadales bacterium]|nr:hypothetical protein [Chthonomonadales bacterium]